MIRHHGQRDPGEIQAEIERTRDELDQTLFELQNRFTPGQLLDQGWSYLRRNGATEYVHRLGDAARQDPIPLALVGVGLAWLMMSERRPIGRHEDEVASARITSMNDRTSSASEVVSQAGHTVADKTRAASERVAQATETARQRATQVTRTARDRATEVADAARVRAERVRSGYRNLVEEQPLALGAIGLAIGAVMAAMAPRTRTEDAMMGPTKRRLQEDLEEASREPLQRAAQAASAATDAAVDTFSKARQKAAEDSAAAWTETEPESEPQAQAARSAPYPFPQGTHSPP